MTDGEWLLEFFWRNSDLLVGLNKWGGVAMALIGAVLVAPQGSRHLWERFANPLSKAAGTTLSKVRKWLGQSKDVNIPVGPAEVALGGGSKLATEEKVLWRDDFTDDQKVQWLRDRIERVQQDWNSRAEELKEADEGLRDDLNELRLRAFGEIGRLQKLIDAIEAQTVKIDATGLPPIVAGIFLTGVPDELSKWWIGGWLMWGAMALLTVNAIRVSRRSGVWKAQP